MREPMSSVDLAWLRMERPTNPMMIVAVMTLSQRLGYRALCEVLERRFLRFERFLQYPVHDLTGAHWEHAPHFELDAHVHRLVLPPRAGQAQLEAAASKLASTPLDPRQPLWQFHLIERFGKGSAIIARFHHCYADGVALLRVVLSLTDETPQSSRAAGNRTARSPRADRNEATALLGSTVAAAQNALSGVASVLSASLRTVTHPQAAARTALQLGAAAEELARIALLEDDPPTALRGELGVHKQVAWATPIPLVEVKSIGKAVGCTITDVLLATLAGALGTYLRRRDAAPAPASIRALVPVNLREGREPVLGNHFGLVFASLPIGERNPIARIRAVHADMEALKHSAQPILALGLLTAMGVLPAVVEEQSIDLLTRKASLVVSSVPGPKQTLYLAGARIEQQHFWVPQAGGIGAGASLLSYDGAVHFGFMADRNLIATPSEVTRAFNREFEKLLLGVVSAGAPIGKGETRHRHQTSLRRKKKKSLADSAKLAEKRTRSF